MSPDWATPVTPEPGRPSRAQQSGHGYPSDAAGPPAASPHLRPSPTASKPALRLRSPARGRVTLGPPDKSGFAVALGARCTLVGRAYLYGLMAGGQAGVERAIEILGSGVTRTMRLLGVTCLEELSPKHVTQLRRLGPVTG